MKIGHTIDTYGYLVDDVLSDSGVTPDVTVICPDGFYRPNWNGTSWVEGMSQEDIDEIVNAPKPPSQEDRIKAVEDLLLEMMLGGL